MAVREAGSRWRRDDAQGTDCALGELRARWRTASTRAGWRFPSDWGAPEVDEVCAAVLAGGDLLSALGDLARARAFAGADLDETLADLAALHAVLEGDDLECLDLDATPAALLRSTAIAWADAALSRLHAGDITDTLSGQANADYLRVRLGEIYAECRRKGFCPTDRYVLLVATLDLTKVDGWSRLMAMVLVGDVLRSVFDGGETVAVLGPSVAVVLTERDTTLAERASDARILIKDRLTLDPDLGPSATPEVRIQRLPTGEPAAINLLRDISRA
ncbi:hypothetical protein [Actinokineospora terrae]|uniref:GGDEF domain-containing protein, diguanylate cyclase (C-di-GMP synthetase) or its enzymatically inactive variants n=1 Tax=Actinokineospora terrae TaxID=155974 RepID=A0A1H9SF80_9PSEU|nr:hypothetical protein [Actinokineospora terrae]SER83023.1 hypothetical protein SAMN04487818_105402 [Actinokineospora terrae]